MKSILDRSFRYTPAASTNIAATFRRIRAQLKQAEKERLEREQEARVKVKQIARGKA